MPWLWLRPFAWLSLVVFPITSMPGVSAVLLRHAGSAVVGCRDGCPCHGPEEVKGSCGPKCLTGSEREGPASQHPTCPFSPCCPNPTCWCHVAHTPCCLPSAVAVVAPDRVGLLLTETLPAFPPSSATELMRPPRA
jgi:hypothetical protein